MVSVQALSNTILKKAFSESVPVTPMKLQKILYFIYRNYYQKTGEPLFSESFLTWKYGPVVRSVYDDFKSYGAKPITTFAKDVNGNAYVIVEDRVPDIAKSINDEWEKCKAMSGVELSAITHKPNSAWRKAYEERRPCLDDEDIRNDYTR